MSACCTCRADRFDGHAHAQALVAPDVGLLAGLLDDPVAQRADQSGLLGQRHEDLGADRATGRVFPAQQRLGGGDLAADRVDLGLEVQLQGARSDGAAQVVLQFEVGRGGGLQRLAVDAVAGAALAAGLAHRQFGAGDQAHGRGRARPGDDADRAAQRNAFAVDVAGCAHRLHEPLRDALHVLRVRHAGDEHQEVVASQARHGVAVAGHAPQALGHRGQHQVADLRSVRIVDAAEVVQVDLQHRQRAAAGLVLAHRGAQPGLERHPQRQAGDGVDRRRARRGGPGRCPVVGAVMLAHTQRGEGRHRAQQRPVTAAAALSELAPAAAPARPAQQHRRCHGRGPAQDRSTAAAALQAQGRQQHAHQRQCRQRRRQRRDGRRAGGVGFQPGPGGCQGGRRGQRRRFAHRAPPDAQRGPRQARQHQRQPLRGPAGQPAAAHGQAQAGAQLQGPPQRQRGEHDGRGVQVVDPCAALLVAVRVAGRGVVQATRGQMQQQRAGGGCGKGKKQVAGRHREQNGALDRGARRPGPARAPVRNDSPLSAAGRPVLKPCDAASVQTPRSQQGGSFSGPAGDPDQRTGRPPARVSGRRRPPAACAPPGGP